MSRDGSISILFGDGLHDFRLGIDQLEELQEKTDLGPEELYLRLNIGTWPSPKCIREPLRLGLIGKGMEPIAALVLVERYAGPGALLTAKPIAQAVIAATLVGAPDEDEPPGEPAAGTTSPIDPASQMENGASANSAASAG